MRADSAGWNDIQACKGKRGPETVESWQGPFLRVQVMMRFLVSLSSADYGHIEELISRLLEDNPCGARVSLPSLRIDSFSVELARILGASSKGWVNPLAPEAGSQRMRDVINKKVTEEEILEAATSAFSSGFSHIFLYFMIGLPGETDDDILAISSLVKQIRQIGRDMKVKPKHCRLSFRVCAQAKHSFSVGGLYRAGRDCKAPASFRRRVAGPGIEQVS